MESDIEKKIYLSQKIKELENILNNKQLKNFFYQLNAMRLGASFKQNYSESYLWKYALILSSNACKILLDQKNNIALKSMHYAAQIYELLSKVSLEYDKEYCCLLSATCYDISGYQANALCLIKNLYIFDENDYLSKKENKIVIAIQLFMTRKFYMLNDAIKDSDDLISSTFQNIVEFYIGNKEQYSLELIERFDDLVNEKIKLSYLAFLNQGNVTFSHLIFLFRTKFYLLTECSIIHNLGKYDKLNNPQWVRYAKVLSRNIYGGNRILKKDNRISIIEFWKSQINALEKNIISKNDNYIIQMPTSAGKTFVAEMIILNNLVDNPGGKCIYIAPFKSLVNQVEETLSSHLGKIGYNVSTVIGNYEIDNLDNLIIDEADVLIATPEKIDLLLRLNPHYFDNVVQITFDEGHVLGNISSRSSLMEMLISRLKNKLKDHVKFCFISAVMPELSARQIQSWLGSNSENCISSKDEEEVEWQPTRKIIGKFIWNGTHGQIVYPDLQVNLGRNAFVPNIIEENKYSFLNTNTGRINTKTFPNTNNKSQTAAELAFKYMSDGPVLVFSAQPSNAKSVAKAIVDLIMLKEKIGIKTEMHLEDSNSIQIAKVLLGENSETITFLKHRIGLHTGTTPLAIRKAIEEDYKKGNLKIIVCTNTLGQGVNLPIKTIIVHSMIINQGEYVNERDFWNIVGRSGRAGKETEGQIIFICNSQNDNNKFDHYRDKNNISEINSIFYQIINLLIENRINSEEFDQLISEFIEPQLFAMLIEEAVDTPDEVAIRKIIGSSLFSVQVLNLDDFDDSILIDSLVKVADNFYNATPDMELRKAYANTGFSLESCVKLQNFINENFDMLYSDICITNITENIVPLILLIINSLKNLDEMKSDKGRILYICNNDELLNSIIESWVNGTSITEIQKKNCNESFSANDLNIFIEEQLNYRFSWGSTAFIILLKGEFEKQGLENFEIFDYIPSFIRHGTQSLATSWALSLGVPTRESAEILGKTYESSHENKEIRKFVKWFSNLTKYQIDSWLENRSSYERRCILETAQRITLHKYSDKEDNANFEFYVVGTRYYNESIELSQKVRATDFVVLERDYDNEYDQYAIKVLVEHEFLGFVPRDVAKTISILMDIDNLVFEGSIARKKWVNDHWNIKVNVMETK